MSEVWVKCEICDKGFDSYEALIAHIYSHIDELKHKLQRLLNEFPSKTGGAPGANWRFNLYSTREIDEWKKKFEELLKEEGE